MTCERHRHVSTILMLDKCEVVVRPQWHVRSFCKHSSEQLILVNESKCCKNPAYPHVVNVAIGRAKGCSIHLAPKKWEQLFGVCPRDEYSHVSSSVCLPKDPSDRETYDDNSTLSLLPTPSSPPPHPSPRTQVHAFLYIIIKYVMFFGRMCVELY